MVETRGLKKAHCSNWAGSKATKRAGPNCAGPSSPGRAPAAEKRGDVEGELEGPVEGSDVGPEEGALLKVGLPEGDEEGCGETLDTQMATFDDSEDGSDLGPEEAFIDRRAAIDLKTSG